MKVAISAAGKDMNAQIDPRFGRCMCFIIVETDDMSYESFDNESIALSGGAGIQSASFIVSKGVKAVLTGNCGPKAMQTLDAGGVEIYLGQQGTVAEAVERFKTGQLNPAAEANVDEKFGVNSTGAMGAPQPVARRAPERILTRAGPHDLGRNRGQ